MYFSQKIYNRSTKFFQFIAEIQINFSEIHFSKPDYLGDIEKNETLKSSVWYS